MVRNFERQIKDIQVYADQILNNNTTINEIENFSAYTEELKSFISKEIQLKEILELNNEIPEIKINLRGAKARILGLLLPAILLPLLYEKRAIEEAKQAVQIAKSKFASIEFLYKANK